MNVWNQFYARAVLPALDGSYRGLGAQLGVYRRREREAPERARDRQWEALRRLLRHAYATCPFYRERFDAAGLDPERLQAPEDLSRLPPLTREDMRRHGEAMRSRSYPLDQLSPAASGGTTDTPVPFWRDAEAVRAKHAVQESFNLWAGWRPGDKVFHLWGARSDFAQHPSWRWRLYERHIKRDVFAPSSYLDAATMERYRRAMNRFRPRILHAYPTPLALWSEFLLACGRPYHRPHAIVVTAEMLLPGQRALMERTFGCPVIEHYGSREFGMIAAQCEARAGLHLHPEAAYVETAPVDAEGAVRELLVTDLMNFGMPLIRYRINDCVAEKAQPCSCGRGYPVLPAILGRTADVFRLPNGALVPGVGLTNRVLKVAPGLRKTQVIQESLRHFRLRYVPGPGFTAADLAPLRAKLDEFLGGGLEWEWEAVEEIPREASGKTRFCISHVDAAAATGAGRG